jgi:hypothetical protein
VFVNEIYRGSKLAGLLLCVTEATGSICLAVYALSQTEQE